MAVRPPLFTDVEQIAVVVRDLDASMRAYWKGYGIGPWSVIELDPERMGGSATRGGAPAEHRFRIALAQVGRLHWELIEPLDDESIYAQFLREHGEGVHHVAVRTRDFGDALARLERLGRRNLQGGVIDGITHAYMSTDEDLGVATEVYDWPPEAVLRPPDRVYPPDLERTASAPPAGGLVALVRDTWYPAWDGGDPALLERVTRETFAAHAAITAKPGAEPVGLAAVLPGWLAEAATWRPQRHEVLTSVEQDDRAAWTMRWTATHAGPLRLPDGRVIPPTGETVEVEAAFVATWDGRRITSFQAFSDYHGMVARLEAIAARAGAAGPAPETA